MTSNAPVSYFVAKAFQDLILSLPAEKAFSRPTSKGFYVNGDYIISPGVSLAGRLECIEAPLQEDLRIFFEEYLQLGFQIESTFNMLSPLKSRSFKVERWNSAAITFGSPVVALTIEECYDGVLYRAIQHLLGPKADIFLQMEIIRKEIGL